MVVQRPSEQTSLSLVMPQMPKPFGHDRWYEFVHLFCGECLFALRWECTGSLELPISEARSLGPVKLQEHLQGFLHL